jgi:hypothetical protein
VFSCLSTYQIQQLTAEIKTQQTCCPDKTCQLCSGEFFPVLFLRYYAKFCVFDFQTEPKPSKTGGTGPKKVQKFEVVIPKYFSKSKKLIEISQKNLLHYVFIAELILCPCQMGLCKMLIRAAATSMWHTGLTTVES